MCFAKLRERIAITKSRLCAGLDPHARRQALPHVRDLREWSLRFVQALHDTVPAFKFQYAYFEAYGPEGLSVLKEVIDSATEHGAFTILDAKRSDIEPTLTEFVETAFPISPSRPFCWGVDAVTINPFLALETLPTILRLLADTRRAIYLVLSPTAGNSDRLGSHLRSQLEACSKLVADKAATWARECAGRNGEVSLGMVVSAVDPCGVAFISRTYSLPLLIPGVGYQGGAIGPIARYVSTNEQSVFSVSRALYPAISHIDAGWRAELRSQARMFNQLYAPQV